jgi:hypothetical protein
MQAGNDWVKPKHPNPNLGKTEGAYQDSRQREA